MATFSDSLRGYAFEVHKRDTFRCRYCGLDGTQSFSNWLSLSEDHLLPKGHRDRDKKDFIVTACLFCNAADNWYFKHAAKRGLRLDGLSPDELVLQRLPFVLKIRKEYEAFWQQRVRAG
jgi:hypothetical protein